MSDRGQFKSFNTRKFRADLHYRLKVLAANKMITMEEAFNDVVEIGLSAMEKKLGVVEIGDFKGRD